MRTKSLAVFLALLLVCSWGVTPFTALANGPSSISAQDGPSKVLTNENTEIRFQGGNTFVFNNSKIEPVIDTVWVDKIAIPRDNYDVSYANNLDAGENASVTIIGKGTYSGSCTVPFVIEKRELRDVFVSFEGKYEYTGSKINPEPTIMYNGNLKLIEGLDNDYTVTYPEPSENPGTYAATIVASPNSKNFTGTTTAYYTITRQSIKGGNLEIENSQPCTYTGSRIDPVVTVSVSGQKLDPEQDYSLTFVSQSTGKTVDAIVDAGTYTILAAGAGGNFEGELSRPFTVSQASMSNVELVLTPTEYEYDGTKKEPAIIAKNGEVELKAEDDYDSMYLNNTNPGTATVMLFGKRNYTGIQTANFQINAVQNSAGGNGSGGSGSGNGSGGNGDDANGGNGSGNGNDGDANGGNSDGSGLNGSGNGSNGNGAGDGSGSGSGLNGGSGANGAFGVDGSSGANGASGADGSSGASGSGSASGSGTSAGDGSTTDAASDKDTIPMYRLYNPNSGEHFYTASVEERRDLIRVGWRSEGIGWYAPKTGNPVYRLYNPFAGDHHYTMSAEEASDLIVKEWRSEGVGWYSASADGEPLYRQYNPNTKVGTHNYTTSKAEHKHLIRVGWRGEGVSWYGVKK